MIRPHQIFIAILITLLGCNQAKNQKITADLNAQTLKPELIINSTDSETSSEVDCIRGAAEPIIRKSVFPDSNFKLQSDKITGIETVNFDNGSKLIIKNWGCEYYCLTFRFETTRFQEDTTNLQFWYKKSVLLISEILNGLEAPTDIKKGTNSLVNYIDLDLPNNYVNLKLKDEIDFGGEDIREYVTLDRIQKIDDKKYAIEISYITGPL